MILTDEHVKMAKELAERVHKDQKRWNGDPYITHPERIVKALIEEKYSISYIICAWLHDVIEDSDYSQDICTEIKDKFGEKIFNIVNLLTRGPKQEYWHYIRSLNMTKDLIDKYLCTTIKRYDLKDNLRDIEPGNRKDKYMLALMYLEG